MFTVFVQIVYITCSTRAYIEGGLLEGACACPLGGENLLYWYLMWRKKYAKLWTFLKMYMHPPFQISKYATELYIQRRCQLVNFWGPVRGLGDRSPQWGPGTRMVWWRTVLCWSERQAQCTQERLSYIGRVLWMVGPLHYKYWGRVHPPWSTLLSSLHNLLTVG